ncbi:MAG: GvpL/GvpF family gas vesicle protein [Proteobacteria bacterium]|nr:GvpL/GvpF family gas vesicle protein [Pseudomonadota bacterium]MBU1585174.1 GvpL/GvpF family gas vesicle protein [Pseudomonadota bacterium]MBU2454487.1 GvpL/GvpF family gas vesicle protein [Pseudomonadota bacterium]MBU2629064.1 GvpL/GvpF family gas vesicle protein [Pseudomonadota bacterium]
MSQIGKYIYCIIEEKYDRNFGTIGIGNRKDLVSTLNYDGISAVISNTPMSKYVINRENLTAHEMVIEQVMKDYTVLPVRFCTIASNLEEIRSLLRRRYPEFKRLFREMDNKIEMGLKVIWKDMDAIFGEISCSNKLIKKIKSNMAGPDANIMIDAKSKIEAGKQVQKALAEKKEDEGQMITRKFKRISVDIKENKIIGDAMLLNLACLIDRTHEKEFDNTVNDLAAEYENRLLFKYVGPIPPFNFVNIEVT